MERASCSDSCPGVFSQLKEVYLFGCNTLNAEALRSASGEVARSLVRAGYSQADAARLSQILGERHAESNRDRMRQIFKDVPVIYGFSSKAPLGRAAGPVLEQYLQSGGAGEVASGKPSARLLSLFAPVSMTVVAGLTDADVQASHRRDVCQFADDRLAPEQKLRFVHQLLQRDAAEVRMFLDRLEQYSTTLDATLRHSEAVAKALDEIAADRAARARYLEFMRDADEPSVHTRMIALAERLGWLTPAEKHAELVRTLRQHRLKSSTGQDLIDVLIRRLQSDLAAAA
jgi:hypothetical protein